MGVQLVGGCCPVGLITEIGRWERLGATAGKGLSHSSGALTSESCLFSRIGDPVGSSTLAMGGEGGASLSVLTPYIAVSSISPVPKCSQSEGPPNPPNPPCIDAFDVLATGFSGCGSWIGCNGMDFRDTWDSLREGMLDVVRCKSLGLSILMLCRCCNGETGVAISS